MKCAGLTKNKKEKKKIYYTSIALYLGSTIDLPMIQGILLRPNLNHGQRNYIDTVESYIFPTYLFHRLISPDGCTNYIVKETWAKTNTGWDTENSSTLLELKPIRGQLDTSSVPEQRHTKLDHNLLF